MLNVGTVIKLDTEWLEGEQYTPSNLITGDTWIWSVNDEGEIVYFEKESTINADSDDYPTIEDCIYKVVIDRTFPYVYIKIVEVLNVK